MILKKNAGITLGIFNTDESITSFAHASFKYALEKKNILYISLLKTLFLKLMMENSKLFLKLYMKKNTKLNLKN